MEIVKIMAYFIIYSFIGWFIESAFKSFLEKKLINSGFLIGPFCPIYGVGALMMLWALSYFKMNVFILFLVGFIVLSIWEYIVGWFLEVVFKAKYWDYTDNFCNIKGRVCLFNSTCWGILSVLFMNYWHPFIEDKVNMVPDNILVITVSILSAYIIADTIQSIIKLKTLDKKIEKLKELNETIKEKLAELNNIKITTPDYKKSLQDLVVKLQEQQQSIKGKVLKQTTKLKKAFPKMKSEKLTEFLNQKFVEIKEIREKIK